jgi:hypothetical protein
MEFRTDPTQVASRDPQANPQAPNEIVRDGTSRTSSRTRILCQQRTNSSTQNGESAFARLPSVAPNERVGNSSAVFQGETHCGTLRLRVADACGQRRGHISNSDISEHSEAIHFCDNGLAALYDHLPPTQVQEVRSPHAARGGDARRIRITTRILRYGAWSQATGTRNSACLLQPVQCLTPRIVSHPRRTRRARCIGPGKKTARGIEDKLKPSVCDFAYCRHYQPSWRI